ncbi:unnamed protein product [Amoebophrya sp. A120]|nr:unnamed protein product [Amoebophrya sp. A120]|eukprot:GSA120T00006697001.1
MLHSVFVFDPLQISAIVPPYMIFHQKEKRIKLRHRHLMTTSFVAQHSQRTRASSFSSCTSTRRRPLTCFCTRVLHRGVCPVVAC